MSETGAKGLPEQQGLVRLDQDNEKDEYLGDIGTRAQEVGQRFQDAAMRAKDIASERLTQAGDKLRELQDKDPRELLEDAKEYARQKPGQALLISAAVGLVVGLLLRRK